MARFAQSIEGPSSPVNDSHHPDGPQHKRVYQACIPCRRRKVRCDLGSVDNPHDPPCVRCRRESKECYFSATRRKRKNEEGDESVEPEDDYVARNGRKKPHLNGPPGRRPSSPSPVVDPRFYNPVPLTPGGSAGRTEPLRRPHRRHGKRGSDSGADAPDDSNAQLENIEAQAVMRRGMFGPHDALDLLYKAATDSPAATASANQPQHKRDVSSASIAVPVVQTVQPNNMHAQQAAQQPSANISAAPKRPPPQRGSSGRTVKMEQLIDPDLAARNTPLDDNAGPTGPNAGPDVDPAGPMPRAAPNADAVKAWSRFRFVRAGWFSAREAIDYIDYYYEYLSPLTPISPPTFQNPDSHITLLSDEPILTVTLLTIASRYRRLPGPGGHCRSHAIHEKLWTYLRGMIERCFWGQESFGGGGMPQPQPVPREEDPSSTAPWRGLRRGSLRTLGTIESLMILTEWHPRALHFPPDEAIYELMLPVEADLAALDEDLEPPHNGRRLESWLEPAWRSDRMCWMLLSTAMGLAYELGVFDEVEELVRDDAITRPEYEEELYRQRASRIKRLLMIYLTQLAGRLGWTNMVPESLRKGDPAVTRRRPASGSNEAATPATNPSSLGGSGNLFNYIPDLELDDQIIHCWAGISDAMHMANLRLFKSRKHTAEIIQSNQYIGLLHEFKPILTRWLGEFQHYRMPTFIRHVLTIEYEYVRIYINSLSLQAVVERCTNNTATGNSASAAQAGTAAQLSPQTQNLYGQLPLGHIGGFSDDDQQYIKEVVDGCRSLLTTVVDGLLPGGYLKHAPVRTYFRIISGAMFLLKTFALGAPRSDVKISIDLMDRTVEALKTCVVDDVHLGTRFADLLESLTSRLRHRFVQAPAVGSPMPNNSDVVMANGLGVGDGSWQGHASRLTDNLDGGTYSCV